MISPYLLKKKRPQITIHKVVQERGEFVIRFGDAYSSCFDYGYNAVEEANFLTEFWRCAEPEARPRCSNFEHHEEVVITRLVMGLKRLGLSPEDPRSPVAIPFSPSPMVSELAISEDWPMSSDISTPHGSHSKKSSFAQYQDDCKQKKSRS